MILMLAPGPKMQFGAMPSGASYVSDQFSQIQIVNDSTADQAALQAVGCAILTPFGGWGNFGFNTLANLYSADAASNLVLPNVTGFPQHVFATVTSDGGNNGTWLKTGSGTGSGSWTLEPSLSVAGIAAQQATNSASISGLSGSVSSLSGSAVTAATAIGVASGGVVSALTAISAANTSLGNVSSSLNAAIGVVGGGTATNTSAISGLTSGAAAQASATSAISGGVASNTASISD